MSLQIRPLRLEDQEAVLAVARTLAAWFRPLDQMALAIDLRDHEGLVAREGDELLGFLTYHLLDAQQAELSWLGVTSAQQARGIGGRLLRALERQLRALQVERLQVSTVPADYDPTFEGTNAFYLRHGFTIQQRDEHFYAYQRPRLLLEKRLRPA